MYSSWHPELFPVECLPQTVWILLQDQGQSWWTDEAWPQGGLDFVGNIEAVRESGHAHRDRPPVDGEVVGGGRGQSSVSGAIPGICRSSLWRKSPIFWSTPSTWSQELTSISSSDESSSIPDLRQQRQHGVGHPPFQPCHCWGQGQTGGLGDHLCWYWEEQPREHDEGRACQTGDYPPVHGLHYQELAPAIHQADLVEDRWPWMEGVRHEGQHQVNPARLGRVSCGAWHKTQEMIADTVISQLHLREQMSSVEHLGSLAKAVLEALKDHTEAGGRS